MLKETANWDQEAIGGYIWDERAAGRQNCIITAFFIDLNY